MQLTYFILFRSFAEPSPVDLSSLFAHQLDLGLLSSLFCRLGHVERRREDDSRELDASRNTKWTSEQAEEAYDISHPMIT
jgi:hypothetical protein